MSAFKNSEKILNQIKKNNYKIIAIDGPTGSGKSKLATYLAEKLNTSPIHLDKYLQNDDRNYYKKLDYDQIKNDILTKKHIIIEGILMLEVLKKLQIKPELTIFCSDQAFLEEWRFYIESEKSFDSIIEERINNINVIRTLEGKRKIEKLDKFHFEIDKYFFDYLPFDNADMLFDFSSEAVD